jgi:hypothetical protein
VFDVWRLLKLCKREEQVSGVEKETGVFVEEGSVMLFSMSYYVFASSFVTWSWDRYQVFSALLILDGFGYVAYYRT